MSRSNRWVLGLIVLSLSVTITIIPTVRSQTVTDDPFRLTLVAQETDATKPASASAMVCKVYALSDFCEDAKLCQWISETVPQVIEPGTWGQGESGKAVLTYYALGKTLVVFHTPDTHKKVEAFLGNLKTAMPIPKVASPVPTGKLPANNQRVVPAQYSPPSVIKTADSTPLPADYPVPAQTKSPKHLFHFIIRYEGDGIIDSNVVDFMKVQMGQHSNNTPVTSGCTPVVGAPVCAIPTGTYIQNSPTSQPGNYITPATQYSGPLPQGMFLTKTNPPMYTGGVPGSPPLPLPPPPPPPGTFPHPMMLPMATTGGATPAPLPPASVNPPPANNCPSGQIPRPSRRNDNSSPATNSFSR